jgi:hypothetical protein
MPTAGAFKMRSAQRFVNHNEEARQLASFFVYFFGVVHSLTR